MVEQDYHLAAPDKQPRYYQDIAINRAIEAIVKGQDRVLLVMATGTGKTYVASQIMNDDNTLRVTAPIFLLRSTESCWRCHASQEVIAIAFRWRPDKELATDEQPQEGEPLILENIHEMPEAILAYVVSVHPHFENRTSKTAGTAHYMNTCDCGAHFGDFYLFNEPGGAFFPTDEAEAGNITIEELPFTGTFEFDCSYGMGLGDLIFEHAKKLNSRE